MELAPRERVERLSQRLAHYSPRGPELVQSCLQLHASQVGFQVLPDRRNSPKRGQLRYANAPLSQRDEVRSGLREIVDTGELAGTETLHVDAVAQERMPGQFFVGIGDEDSRTIRDGRGISLPHEVQLGTPGVDLRWQEGLIHGSQCTGWPSRNPDHGPDREPSKLPQAKGREAPVRTEAPRVGWRRHGTRKSMVICNDGQCDVSL